MLYAFAVLLGYYLTAWLTGEWAIPIGALAIVSSVFALDTIGAADGLKKRREYSARVDASNARTDGPKGG